jgi:hypothetical protein
VRVSIRAVPFRRSRRRTGVVFTVCPCGARTSFTAPDMETLQSELATPEAAETQVRDGVHVATIRMFIDA